jgi:hypothetical protein
MSESIEEIAPIKPVERREMLRRERRNEPPEEDDTPTPPARHPHKGNILDVVV